VVPGCEPGGRPRRDVGNTAMRRIALFSDVHGNLPALDAVLTDIGAEGITEVYCLGDLVGYGPDPAGVVERIRGLGIPTIRGNYDDGIGNRRGECGCYYATEEAKADGAASYVFTDVALDDRDHAWLAALPDDMRLAEGDVRIQLAHGSPRKINEYLRPDRKDDQLARLADRVGADVVCVGHIHIPYHRTLVADDSRRVHYVSSGSAGKPKDGDPRACWVELAFGAQADIAAATNDGAAGPAGATGTWLGVAVHRASYDIDSVVNAMRAVGLPVSLADALRGA
jgi:predicted phosphodiesterase